MTAKKGEGAEWRQTPVVLRGDILAQAQASGLDIDELCNRALASATGIRYDPPPSGDVSPAAPVIIAHDSIPSGGDTIPAMAQPSALHPVINADDPGAVTTVKHVSRAQAPKTLKTLPGRVSTPVKTPQTPPVPAVAAQPEKPGKPETRPEKKGRGSAIKKFVAENIVREDAEEAHVSKDALYQAFTRWCREHRVTQVPDRKAVTIALKNQYAMKEKTVDGEPSWVNVRLR
jgi:hypothetical protein